MGMESFAFLKSSEAIEQPKVTSLIPVFGVSILIINEYENAKSQEIYLNANPSMALGTSKVRVVKQQGQLVNGRKIVRILMCK